MIILRSEDRHDKGLRHVGPHTTGLGKHLKFSHLQQNDLRVTMKTVNIIYTILFFGQYPFERVNVQ